jgi:SNF2 family DNA or RNA helicase/predicted SprT family Zn-dependent metalloprotease
MIRQYEAQQLCDDYLREHNLFNKGWRTVFTKSNNYIGRCYHDAKRIELSLIHLNVRSEAELRETILHEIAHALIGPNKGHNSEWKNKAIEIGLSNPQPCGQHIDLDKGRGLQASEVKAKRQFHRLDKQCPICHVKAEEVSFATLNGNRWTKLKCGHLVKQDTIKSNIEEFSNWTSISGKVIFPYQVEGIKFLEQSGGRALIADEPGLGKTIQALGFAYFHKDEVCPILWVCKTTLKLQALKEALDWCGPSFMGQIIDSPKAFIIPNLKLYIISMDLLRNMPSEKLEKIGFKAVIADEIQHFKNPDSSRTAELRKLVSKADYFIPLSGTPWKNRGSEYFPVLNMLDPSRFPSYEHFKNHWVDTYLDRNTGKIKQGGIRNIPAFREFTKDIVIRRMRDDVLPDLPKINRQIRFIDMEGLYNSAYDKAEEQVAARLKAAMIDGLAPQSIASAIMQLKHITGLAKVQVAIEDTIEFLDDTDEAEKITLFCHHIDVADNIQKGDGHTYKGLDEWLVANGFNKSLRLHGGKDPETRNNIINDFKLIVRIEY